MAMTLAQLGNGSGFVYITEADGTTIISNLNNTDNIWQEIQKFASASASLDVSTDVFAATFGYRFFGDTGGSAGSIATATEITRFVVTRDARVAKFKKAITIATGVIEIERVGNDMIVVVDTEGAVAADDLDTITSSGVVDGDTLTIVGAVTAQVSTLKHGTGNIFLSDNNDFATGNRQTQIVLQYFSAATAGWYEVSRKTVQPTVTDLRAAGIAAPVQGVNLSTMGTGATVTYQPGVDKGYQVTDGTPTLIANQVYTTGGAPIDGDEFTVDYRSVPVLGAFSVTIFGIALTATQAAQKCVVRTKYRTANTTWYSTLYVNGNAVDFATTTQLATKEDDLGNPASDGMVLSSDTAGTRAWVSNDSGASVLHNETSNNETSAALTEEVLKSYTLPAGTLGVNGDLLRIRAVYQTAANANAKTCSMYFGATKIAETTLATNADTATFDIVVNRVGGTSQSAASRVEIIDIAAFTSVGFTGRYTTPGETLSGDVDMQCRATNGVAAAGDIICRQFSVEVYKKRN